MTLTKGHRDVCQKIFPPHKSTMCCLKKLASGVFPESWKVLAERRRQQQRQWKRTWTKNNKSPGYPGWLNNSNSYNTGTSLLANGTWIFNTKHVLPWIKRFPIVYTYYSSIKMLSHQHKRFLCRTQNGISYTNKIAWSWEHLIFNMGIPILVRQQLYIKVVPWFQNFLWLSRMLK